MISYIRIILNVLIFVGHNYGKPFVDVFAPGNGIASTWPMDAPTTGQVGYMYSSGTSMATPHVSGLAALILSIRNDLSGEEVKKYIMDNVQKKTQYSELAVSSGLIDVGKTIKAVINNEGKYVDILHPFSLNNLESTIVNCNDFIACSSV